MPETNIFMPEPNFEAVTGQWAAIVEMNARAGLRASALLIRSSCLVKSVGLQASGIIQHSFMPEEVKSAYEELVIQRIKIMAEHQSLFKPWSRI